MPEMLTLTNGVSIRAQVSEDVRQCIEHWIAEGWCGVAEDKAYDEHGNEGYAMLAANVVIQYPDITEMALVPSPLIMLCTPFVRFHY
ncbi:hypothetical protein EVAR_87934_1 [Eumeta japonica]|uniref:Uncharacterized protein n=1 Tax=Eumeta variegata TaxID=151549 RepID=A0A4C2AA08_EUMVA|nr:hypothetical protein EVAR_87934_1 [Eumeta japonica]